MCKYCDLEPNKKTYLFPDVPTEDKKLARRYYLQVFIEKNLYKLRIYVGQVAIDYKIKFCPMCGGKL